MDALIKKRRFILWKIEYHINIEPIDTEHKKLFDMAQEVLEINNDIKRRNNELKTTMSKLLMYLKIHFSHEQRYMKETKYPELNYHITLHESMIEKLTFIIKELNNYDSIEIENTLYIFIEEYFLQHIMAEDKKIHIWNSPLIDLRKDFGWKDFYSVLNQEIDDEHKILFDIASEAFNTIDSPNRVNKIKTTIKKLYDYMQTHFQNEEKYMERIGYYDLAIHKKLHKNIIIQLNNFVKQLAFMKLETFEKELAKIIDISLLQHIIQEDRKIIAWQKFQGK